MSTIAPQSATLTRIEDYLYLFQGAGNFNVNSLVLEDQHSFILIDTQLEDTNNQALIQGIKTHLPGKELRLAIISHSHLDHYLGLKFFRDAFGTFDILGVPDAPRQMDLSTAIIWESYLESSSNPQLTKADIIYPTQAATAAFSIPFSGRVMHFDLAGPNESWATLTSYLPDTKTLYASDIFFGGLYLDPRIGGTLIGWAKESAHLLSHDISRVISGHTTQLHTPAALEHFAHNTQCLLEISQQLITQGLTLEQFQTYQFPPEIILYAPRFTLTNIYHELHPPL